MDKKILIIGGDKRQQYLRNILLDKGYVVFHIMNPADLTGCEAMGEYEDIILPLPASRDGINVYCINKELKISLEDIYSSLGENQILYGGNIRENLKCRCVDLLRNESFIRANALLTSQGALRLLLENTEDYIFGKRVLITGFGNVARSLAPLLSAMPLEVIIAARSPSQLYEAEDKGYSVAELCDMSEVIPICDFIFSTVPHKVFSSEDIKLMGENALYFELASAPYGAKREDFEKYGKRWVDGSALPGRFLPLASAKLIAEQI